jgi:hypothetical protein
LLAEDFLSDESMAIMTKKQRVWALAFVFMGGKLNYLVFL